MGWYLGGKKQSSGLNYTNRTSRFVVSKWGKQAIPIKQVKYRYSYSRISRRKRDLIKIRDRSSERFQQQLLYFTSFSFPVGWKAASWCHLEPYFPALLSVIAGHSPALQGHIAAQDPAVLQLDAFRRTLQVGRQAGRGRRARAPLIGQRRDGRVLLVRGRGRRERRRALLTG